MMSSISLYLCSTIWDYLDRFQWSRTVARRRAIERNEDLRGKWVGYCLQFTSDQLVFIDESAANERTADRKYGWSPIGIECEAFSSIKRSERWSLLPALDANGYFTWLIYQGGITSSIFLDFIHDQVLPKCEPFPGKRSVLVMDNASIHHSQALKDLCSQYGVRLEFLPPYSPDKNPIEVTFKDLKAWIRRHYSDVSAFDRFDNFLNTAVEELCKKDMTAYFRHCGYRI
jgi:transposase